MTVRLGFVASTRNLLVLLLGMGTLNVWGQEDKATKPLPERPYFYFDAESQKSGDPLSQPPFFPHPWKEANADHPNRGKIVADPTAPQGGHIFMWDVARPKTTELLHEVKFDRMPAAATKDYYLACFFRFDRKDGKDIWHDGEGDSFDKWLEVVGNGIRWVIHLGNHAVRMKDHHFSCYVSNSTYHLNRKLEVYDGYYPNHGGFSQYKSPELEYEKWHAVVFKMKWATDDTGEIGLWINGKKALEYTGIKTAKAPGTFERLQFFGTIAQPAYDAPPHVRKMDALIFTDNWQDIVDGGYLKEVTEKKE
jgi:hypothetical protein